MAKTSPTSLPVDKFFGKYASAIQKAHARENRPRLISAASLLDDFDFEFSRLISTDDLWRELPLWWPIRMLRDAAGQGDTEGCKRLLHYFLGNLGIHLPKGVLVPFRWNPGRPKQTERIYEAWIAKGRPVLNWRICDELAKTFYAEEFATAQSDPSLRKRLRDRIRATILRHEAAPAATKPTQVS